MNNNYIKLTFMEYLLFPKNCAKHFIYIHIYIYIYIHTHTHTHTFISQMNLFAKERVTYVENKLMVTKGVCAKLLQSCLTLQDPMDYSLPLLCPCDSLGKCTGVDCHALLQGIFLTQGSNQCLLYFLRW